MDQVADNVGRVVTQWTRYGRRTSSHDLIEAVQCTHGDMDAIYAILEIQSTMRVSTPVICSIYESLEGQVRMITT